MASSASWPSEGCTVHGHPILPFPSLSKSPVSKAVVRRTTMLCGRQTTPRVRTLGRSLTHSSAGAERSALSKTAHSQHAAREDGGGAAAQALRRGGGAGRWPSRREESRTVLDSRGLKCGAGEPRSVPSSQVRVINVHVAQKRSKCPISRWHWRWHEPHDATCAVHDISISHSAEAGAACWLALEWPRVTVNLLRTPSYLTTRF